jgi:hypothetical protein
MTVMVIGHKDSIHIAQSQYLVIMSFAILESHCFPSLAGFSFPVGASTGGHYKYDLRLAL